MVRFTVFSATYYISGSAGLIPNIDQFIPFYSGFILVLQLSLSTLLVLCRGRHPSCTRAPPARYRGGGTYFLHLSPLSTIITICKNLSSIFFNVYTSLRNLLILLDIPFQTDLDHLAIIVYLFF